MIKVNLTNDILKRISAIDNNRHSLSTVVLPTITINKLRKNSKKKSSYASNKIEGNPLTEGQSDAAIESDAHKRFMKPEQEVRNYYMALNLLEEKVKANAVFSKDLIMEVQAMVEKGASKEKIGLRGAMPPGVLFAVYDSESGKPDYIPPEYIDIPGLLDEFSSRVCTLSIETSDDHLYTALSYLNLKEKEFLKFLIKKHLYEFTPIDVSKMMKVSNKTIINRCAKLSGNGFLIPMIVKERIRSYRFSDFTRENEKRLLYLINSIG